MRSRYGPILGWGRGWLWRYPGGALFVRIFWSVLQCIPVSRRICRLLTPSTSTRRRISVHCSISRYILLFYQDAALLDRHAHPPHFSTALYITLSAIFVVVIVCVTGWLGWEHCRILLRFGEAVASPDSESRITLTLGFHP